MGLSVVPSAMAVLIGGVPYPLAVVASMGDHLAPEVDVTEIAIPWGHRHVSGSADPAETLPALGAPVVVTCGGYTWRGLLTSRRRKAHGLRRSIELTASGPSLVADRSYLPTFARYGLSGVAQVPGGPRFAPGTRSATPDGPGGTYYIGGSGDWTVGQALDSLLAHAPLAGLPAITLDAAGADLTRSLPDTECDGISFHATLQSVMAHRMGLVWRLQIQASGWVLVVRSSTQAGTALDLTGGDVTGYEIAEDASAALAALTVRGARLQYVISADCYTAGSGDVVPDWTPADVAARTAGDRGSPAYRRFRTTVFALPDGSASVLADPIATLPIAASDPLAEGSSPWLLFAQLASDSHWISLQGQISISVQGTQIWMEGIDPAAWATWNRLRLTMCLSPRAFAQDVKTGGSGLGYGLSYVGTRHVYAAGAAVRISGSSLASVTGLAVSESDPIAESADALWSSLGQAQWGLTWTREGVASAADPPGARKTSVVLPTTTGTETVTIDCVVSSRRITWNAGRPSTTWSAVPRPYATGAVTR